MAKVTAPLFSASASGKIANLMVHFPWKGIAVVRKWLKPSNPMTEYQGNQRLLLGGIGRSTRCIGLTSPYHADALALAPSSQTFVSTIVQYIVKNLFPGPKGDIVTQFEAMYTEYNGHTAKTEFDSKAASLGLADFDVSYKTTTHKFVKGMQLYLLAKYATLRHAAETSVFNRVPYTTSLSAWDSGKVDDFATDLASV